MRSFIKQTWSLSTGLVNGVDINQLVRDIVYLDVPQTFSGTVQLNKVVARENIKLVGTLNNVHLPELHKDLSIFELAANQLSTAMGQRMNRHEEALNHLSCFLTGELMLLAMHASGAMFLACKKLLVKFRML